MLKLQVTVECVIARRMVLPAICQCLTFLDTLGNTQFAFGLAFLQLLPIIRREISSLIRICYSFLQFFHGLRRIRSKKVKKQGRRQKVKFQAFFKIFQVKATFYRKSDHSNRFFVAYYVQKSTFLQKLCSRESSSIGCVCVFKSQQ